MAKTSNRTIAQDKMTRRLPNRVGYLLMAVALVVFFSLPGTMQGATASSSKSATTAPIPKSAKIVNQSSKIKDWEVGDIQVTYTDGHKEIVAKGGKCGHPRVSKSGIVGWSVWTEDTGGGYDHTGELLIVRFLDGKTKSFEPNRPFIQNWSFADNDRVVVIKSMATHGIHSLVKYDIITGKELGRWDE